MSILVLEKPLFSQLSGNFSVHKSEKSILSLEYTWNISIWVCVILMVCQIRKYGSRSTAFLSGFQCSSGCRGFDTNGPVGEIGKIGLLLKWKQRKEFKELSKVPLQRCLLKPASGHLVLEHVLNEVALRILTAVANNLRARAFERVRATAARKTNRNIK